MSHRLRFHDNVAVNVENIKILNDVTAKSIKVNVNDMNVNKLIFEITEIIPLSNLVRCMCNNFLMKDMMIEIIKISITSIVDAAKINNNLLSAIEVINMDDMITINEEIAHNINNV